MSKDDTIAPELQSVGLKCDSNSSARLQPVTTLAPQVSQPDMRIGNGGLTSSIPPSTPVTASAPRESQPDIIAGTCD